MKKIVLLLCLSLMTMISYAQTSRVLFSLFGSTKADLIKNMKGTELVKDFGTSIVYEEPGGLNIRYKFDANNVCIGYTYMDMSGGAHKRFEAEVKYMEKEGWVLLEKKEEGDNMKYRYKKGETIVHLSDTEFAFIIGLPEVCEW